MAETTELNLKSFASEKDGEIWIKVAWYGEDGGNTVIRPAGVGGIYIGTPTSQLRWDDETNSIIIPLWLARKHKSLWNHP